jgi:hypothetical protein
MMADLKGHKDEFYRAFIRLALSRLSPEALAGLEEQWELYLEQRGKFISAPDLGYSQIGNLRN